MIKIYWIRMHDTIHFYYLNTGSLITSYILLGKRINKKLGNAKREFLRRPVVKASVKYIEPGQFQNLEETIPSFLITKEQFISWIGVLTWRTTTDHGGFEYFTRLYKGEESLLLTV